MIINIPNINETNPKANNIFIPLFEIDATTISLLLGIPLSRDKCFDGRPLGLSYRSNMPKDNANRQNTMIMKAIIA
jgi:hypothetical protein